ncbi:MAG TPA: phosphate ABC transporter substrate-binding protein [Candidatus Baltobacteraceae bacterium]|nr:phosphate ABC transporter substrate-binding protein [Candidatus Baltobacteraceae bacterium]
MQLRNFSAAALAAALTVTLGACSGNSGSQSSQTSTTTTQSNAQAGATITAVGSTALLPLVKQAATDYQTKHADVKIGVSGGGSVTGITQVAQKGADIGDSDIPATGQPALVDHKVAVVAFGVAVNPQAGVKNLTTQQIRDIFSGKITNWKAAGGANQAITIINRPRSSGTRAVFVDKVMGGAQPSDAGLTQDSSGTVATMVSQTAGAVSYVAMGYVKPGQQVAVAINGVAPNDANVQSGKYPFWSYEHMFTNGQPAANVADFINFVTTDTTLLSQLHFIPVSTMKVH